MSVRPAVGEPRLPQDLERTIFEIAANEERKSIPLLMLVAHRVYTWLQPMFFKVVVMHGKEWLIRPRYLLPRIPTGSNCRHVQRLLYIHYTEEEVPEGPCWDDFISEYCNLQWLAVWGKATPSTALADLTSIVTSPLRLSPCGLIRFSGSLSSIFPGGQVDFSHIVFKDLTHLDTMDPVPDLEVLPEMDYTAQWTEGNNLSCLRKLRYLSFSGDTVPHPYVIVKCLERCKSLELLLILNCYRQSDQDGIAKLVPKSRRALDADGTWKQVPEDRMVMFAGPGDMTDWIVDWQGEALGGVHVWQKGEASVQESRRKREKNNSSNSSNESDTAVVEN